MAAWSGYANAIAIALTPFALLAWLDYWDSPSRQRLALATLVICGVMSIHHLSTLWLGLALTLFSVINLARRPSESFRKLWPIVLAGVVLGAPILFKVLRAF